MVHDPGAVLMVQVAPPGDAVAVYSVAVPPGPDPAAIEMVAAVSPGVTVGAGGVLGMNSPLAVT